MFSGPSASKSSKFFTSTTSAFKPKAGVAIEPPRAQILTLVVFPGVLSIKANSCAPLTHLGTITGCNQTLSKPSFSISSLVYATARSAPREPDNLLPIWFDKWFNQS